MEIRQLEYFQMVSQLNSFTKAAERLHVAQPSVTNAIKKLERELDIQLFDRSQKQIIITPEGEIFLKRAQAILRNINDAITEMREYHQLNKGSIRLGVPPMIGSYLFPKLYLEFNQAFPQIQLDIVEEGSLLTKRMVEAGELDLAIIILSETSALLDFLLLTESQTLVCVSYENHLSKKKTISFSELHDQSFIMLKEGFFHRDLIFQHCRQHNFYPKIIMSSNQLETIKSLVANNVGITFLMEDVIKQDKEIIGIPLHNPIYIPIGLIWKKNRYLSKASQAFMEFMTSKI